MRDKKDLRPYQQRIATHLYEHDEALNVLRPGGGKTAAALTAIAELLRDGVIRHALVVAPKRVAHVVWPDEIEEWAHTAKLRYTVIAGPPAARRDLLRWWGTRDVALIGIDLLPWLLDEMAELPADNCAWDLLVLDEISKFRDPTGKRAHKLAKNIQRWKMVWGLSGTLRPNSAQDLFMPARLVTRGKLWGRSFYKWRKERFYPTDFMGYYWEPLPGAEDKLNAELAPLTVTVAEDEMPKVTPTIIFDKITLPHAARRQYDAMHHALMLEVEKDPVIAASSAVATGKLAQIANGFVYDEDVTARPLHEEKLYWLRELIEAATGPTLLVYEFRADLAVLRREIPGLRWLGAGVTDAQGAANIADWNAGKLKFMALHPASGGHGLNLQHGGADMAWISPTWSPELWEQTIARLARPGQTRPVVVRVCVAQQTVDELKLNRVYLKMSAQEAFETWLRSYHAAAAA